VDVDIYALAAWAITGTEDEELEGGGAGGEVMVRRVGRRGGNGAREREGSVDKEEEEASEEGE
jgi:hypothetical protein